MTIALELGVSRKVVRLACEQLGLRPSDHGHGRRRGVPAQNGSPQATPLHAGSPTGVLILARLISESRPGGPAPTEQQLARRLHALNDAKLNSDALAYEDALLSIASMAGLIHQHERQLRSAA